MEVEASSRLNNRVFSRPARVVMGEGERGGEREICIIRTTSSLEDLYKACGGFM